MDMRKLLKAASPWVPSSAVASRQHQQHFRTRWLDQIAQSLAPTPAAMSATTIARGTASSALSLCIKCRVRATSSTLTSRIFRSTQPSHLYNAYNNFRAPATTVRASLHSSPTRPLYLTRPAHQSQPTTYTATRNPAGPKPIKSSRPPLSPTKGGFYIRSSAWKGYRQRRSHALLHARNRRATMLQAYAAPNAMPPLPRLRHRRSASHRKERRRKDDPSPYYQPLMPDGTVTGARRESPTMKQPYYHLKYRFRHRYPTRVRLLGFQHFLSRQAQFSRLYKMNVWKRIKHAEGRQQFRAKMRRYSIRRHFVRSRLPFLSRLDLALAHKNPAAISIARSLMMDRQNGARQPSGAQFHKLVKLDNTLYFYWTRSGLPSSTTPLRPRDVEAMLTTVDYNHILRVCLDTKDTTNALSITRHLLRRYQSPEFQPQDASHAPPNTGLIYNMMRSLMAHDHCQEALQLFQLVHQFLSTTSSSSSASSPFPKRLDLRLYDSFLKELGARQHFDEMYAVIQFLERHGPQPKMHTYNLVLENVASHGTEAQLEAAMDLLKQRINTSKDDGDDISFNKETYLILAKRLVRQHRIAEAENWLTMMERSGRGYKVTATMFDPLVRECILQAVDGLPELGSARRTNAHRTAAAAAANTKVTKEHQSWIHASLQFLRGMSDRGLVPTVRTMDLLIEGFLRQGRLEEAKQILHTMVTTFAHRPTERILTHFFEYHLGAKEYPAAIATLERMKALAPFESQHSRGTVQQGAQPNLPRRKLYRDLMHTLVADRQWTLAERTIYDMTFTAGVVLSARELASVVARMTDAPDSIERLLAIVGPVAPSDAQPGQRDSHSKDDFLQQAQLALMKAKGEAKGQLERDEVWSMWQSMLTSVYDKCEFALATRASRTREGQDRSQRQQQVSRHDVRNLTIPLRALTSVEVEDRLLQAFTLYARASYLAPSSSLREGRSKTKQQQQKELSASSSAPSSASSSTESPTNVAAGASPPDWIFSPTTTATSHSTASSATSSSSGLLNSKETRGSTVNSSSLSSPDASTPSTSDESSTTATTILSKYEHGAYLDAFIRSTRATLWNQLPSVQQRIRSAAAEILQRRRRHIERMMAEEEKLFSKMKTKMEQEEEREHEQTTALVRKHPVQDREDNMASLHLLDKVRLGRLQTAYGRVVALKVALPHRAVNAYVRSLESYGEKKTAAAVRARYGLPQSLSSSGAKR
ncbi:hypothetical protein BGZ73_005491 [Actinomortierella ambigua]|nr:hypothetical protein BGZ73_005491 [Actinomortierella ambigua]